MKNIPCNSTVKKSLIALSITASLCVSAGAFAGSYETKTSTDTTSDTMGAAMSDTAITTKVKAKLMGVDSLKNSDVDVTTANGVVMLEGTASSWDAKSSAGTLTKSVEGVQSVDNNLMIGPETNSPTTATKKAVTKTERVMSDSWITTKVKSEILADSVSKGFEVSVKTLHGVVMLTGDLKTQAAVDHVVDIAKKVEGVKKVDKSALTVASM